MEQITSSCGDFGRLSDEVILMILNHLVPKDLYNLMKTCHRFHNLCQEDKLWTCIEDLPDKRESINFALNNLLNSKTKRVHLSSVSCVNKGYRSSLSPSLIKILLQKNQQLTELHLINQQLDAIYFRLHDLPTNLKILNMSGCVLSNVNRYVQYLKDFSLKLPMLEELNLAYCSFIESHSLLPISKLPNLTKLILKGCRNIGECLAYVTLASRYGFPKLKVLDVTDTKVASIEFCSFAGISTLEEFYFGQYDPYVDNPLNYITDLCLTRLRNSSTIKILDMSGSRVTDRTLDILETIPNLQKVDAHFTEFSQDAIDAFHLSKPKCRIYMEENPVEILLPQYQQLPDSPNHTEEMVIVIHMNGNNNNPQQV